MTMMSDSFTAADANQDGLLDRAEYGVWMASMKAAAEERGTFEDARPETVEKGYQLCNTVNPDTDGVSLADFWKLTG